MKKFLIPIVLFLMATTLFPTQIEVVGEVFTSYSG